MPDRDCTCQPSGATPEPVERDEQCPECKSRRCGLCTSIHITDHYGKEGK